MQVSLRVRCCGASAAPSSQLLLCCRAYTTAPISWWSSISHNALPATAHAALPLCTLRIHRNLSSTKNVAAAISSAVYTAQRCFNSTAHLCAPRSGKRKTPSRRHSPTKRRSSHRSHEKPNSDASSSAAQHNEKTSDNSHYPDEKLSSFESPMDGGDARPFPSAGASSSVDDQEPAASVDLEPGWGLETVDKVTGKTALEDLYDRNLTRIHRILEQPLPPIPQDGSVDPDFFVGFASYSYQLRDQYRAVIARELQVPVKAVRLSVGWSGRFNVKRFGRVQKVCGVCLDREELSGTENAEVVAAAAAAGVSEGTAPRALPDDVLHRITALIAAINTQKREDLLQVQLFQASPPIPEVEFALTRQEHRLIYHLHDWLRRNVLRRAVAVVVCGLPPPLLPAESKDGEKAEKSAVMERRFAEWRRQAVSATAGQRREVETRWLRLFHRREIVPAIVTLTELATALAVAVVRGDVATVACVAGDGAGDETTLQLHGALREVVVAVAAAASEQSNVSGTSKSEVDGGEELKETPQATAHSKLLTKVDMLLPPPASASIVATAAASTVAGAEDLFATTTQQEAALRWVRLVYQALLLREMHSAGSAGIGAAAASTAAAGVPLNVSFPALFAHGVYAGSRDEVDYLQHNRAAMDALLLHPHEISFKKKFVGRMSSGHRRLKMEAEAAAPHADGG